MWEEVQPSEPPLKSMLKDIKNCMVKLIEAETEMYKKRIKNG